MNILTTYKDLKGEHQYWKLFIASLISRFGDSIDAIAFSWMAYELTGSATWLAIVTGVNTLPTMLFQPFAGVLVERMSKKRLMVWTDIGRGLVVALTAYLLFLGHLNAWLLMLFTFMNSTLEAFRIPAGLAAYPEIVPKEKYTLATSLSQSTSQVAQLIGTGAAGFIIASIGTAGAIFIDALTFFASGIILNTLQLSESKSSTTPSSTGSYMTQLKAGFSYLKDRSVIFSICLLGMLMGVVLVPLNTFQAAYINESLGLGATALSISSISMLFGLSLGSYLFPLFNKKLTRYTLFIIGWLGILLTYTLLSFITSALPLSIIWLLLIATFFICGTLASFLGIAINVAFMTHVDEAYMARAGSIFNALTSSSTPIASFIFAGAVSVLTINQIFFFTAIGGMLILIPMLFNKGLKQL